MAIHRTYVRPMAGWWRRNPSFLAYVAREATAVFVAIYALILLAGLARLSQGRAAFEEWLDGLRSPASIALHALLLAVFLYHTWSWFRIMPKTLPPAVPERVVTGLGLTASAAASLALYALARGLAS